MTNPLNRPHRIEVTLDDNGEFRWRRHAGNSQIISTSAEGYKRERDMWHGLKLANVDWESLRIVEKNPLREENDSPSP